MLRSSANVRCYVSGIGARRADKSATDAVADGATALVSWGSAAGLRPHLRSGDLIVASHAVLGPDTLTADGSLSEFVADTLVGAGPVATGKIAHAPTMLSEPADKAALGAVSLADVADMETFAIATVATQHGLPWTAIRVVVDPSSMRLGKAIHNATTDEGQVSTRDLLLGVIRAPVAELPPLIRLSRAFGETRRTLRNAANCLGWS